jgi:DNA-binding response OmpR family regulator
MRYFLTSCSWFATIYVAGAEGTGAVARILLVEDHQDVRTLLEHVLLGSGYEVDAVETVAQARSLLAALPYDLVIADGKLPDGSGILIADEAKELGMKALVVTGYAFQHKADDLRRHEYLLKPVRPSELLLALRRLIGEI